MKPIDAKVLLTEQSALVSQVRDAAGSDRGFFALYEPLLRICAQYTQRLPLQDNLFRDANGALQFCLILSKTAINTARDRIFFPKEGQEERRALEAQCAYMTFYAALASGVSLLYQNVDVFDAKGEHYHPLLNGIALSRWLNDHPAASFQWTADTPDRKLTQMECAALAAIMLPKGRFQYFNPKVVRMMYAAILPRREDTTTLSTMREVVSDATHAVMGHYLKKESQAYWQSQESQPLVPVDIKVQTQSRAAQVQAQTKPKVAVAPQAAPSSAPQTLDLAKLSPHTREVLAIIQRNPGLIANENIKRTVSGVQVPNAVFGKFGMEPASVRKHFMTDGLVKKTSISVSTLVPEMEPYFLPKG